MHIFSGDFNKYNACMYTSVLENTHTHTKYINDVFLQRNDPEIWTMGSSTCRPWEGILPDAVCSRGTGTVQD